MASLEEGILTNPAQRSTFALGGSLRIPILALTLVCALTMVATRPAPAQTFSVLHTFSGGGDGYQPYAGLTLDSGGSLYGTTSEYTGGTVFKMKRVNGSWVFNTLLSFNGSDGLIPYSKVVFGAHGVLYGTTLEGGNSFNCEFGCGAVYSLRPPMTICKAFSCPWTGIAIQSFTDGADGGNPNFVDPVFDQAGNLYGTTAIGGVGDGVVFEMSESNGAWTESVIHNFSGPDGAAPYSGIIFDHEGNLYGTTGYGGLYNQGTVYRLSPSGSGWTITTLYDFQKTTDGSHPSAALIFDQSGNLYGTTVVGGSGGGGTVFKLSLSGGSWTFSLLYSLVGAITNDYYPGPLNALAMDATGNLYGSAFLDGAYGDGSIFKLTPSNGTWTYTSLHDFTNGDDGANPAGGVTFDTNGNLYGTTTFGGMRGGENCYAIGCGVVWEITP